MKRSKMLAALMLAGLCGISEAEAKSSHKSEIKSLERQRTHLQEEHQESKERLRELNLRAGRKSSDDVADDESELVRECAQRERMNPDLIKEREAEAARVKTAAKEMAKIDKAIRKEKARERERRFKAEVGLPR